VAVVGQAVYGFGQDAAGAGLAGAPRPAEEIGMSDTGTLEGVKQRLGYVLLPYYFSQSLRSPLAIENLRCHVTAIINHNIGHLPKAFSERRRLEG
jgi:hypothetical protein